MNSKVASNAAFSLVEVTLALGVAAFTILTFCGLLAAGVNSNRSSTEQTAATNVLTSIVSDIRSTANPAPKGTTEQKTPVYQIALPAKGTTAATSSSTFYISENAEKIASATGARYLLTIWTTSASTTKPETLVRLLITWPPQAPVANAQGSVESLVVLDRN